MAEIDLSNYLDEADEATASPGASEDGIGGKRRALYAAVIVLCLAGIFLLFKNIDFFSRSSVEKTLPPGVPLEAPPLDQLP